MWNWALTFFDFDVFFLFVFFLIGTSQDDHDPASKIISVDKTGRIMLWPYSRSNYSGFGWFIPSAKYKLRNRYDGGKSHKSHKSLKSHLQTHNTTTKRPNSQNPPEYS